MHLDVFGPSDAPPVLLLHGGGVAGWMWDDLRRRLEEDHRVLVPDLPGHGRSGDADYVDHDVTVAQLLRLIRSHSPGRPVSVVGFSLGAQLAMKLAIEAPAEVARVAVVSAQAMALRFAGATLWLLSAAAPLARVRWFAALQARELFVPAAMLDDYVRTSQSMSKATLVASVTANLGYRLPEGHDFAGPALVLVGEREPRLMRKSAVMVHAGFERSEYEVVAGCGHGIPFQRPDWFGDRIAAWLAEPPSPATLSA